MIRTSHTIATRFDSIAKALTYPFTVGTGLRGIQYRVAKHQQHTYSTWQCDKRPGKTNRRIAIDTEKG